MILTGGVCDKPAGGEKEVSGIDTTPESWKEEQKSVEGEFWVEKAADEYVGEAEAEPGGGDDEGKEGGCECECECECEGAGVRGGAQ